MVQAMRSRRYHGCWFVAHNLAYDLQNLFGRDIDAELCLINRAVYFARMVVKEGTRVKDGSRYDQRSYITLADSTRHYPAALAKIGEKLGIPKLFKDVKNLDTLSDEEITLRCESDCQILYQFVTDLQGAYNELGASFNTTIGSTSKELFQRKYMTRSYIQLEEPDLIELNRSYYGGRCEAFYVGEIPAGTYSMGDVNSMYPAVMRDLTLGVPDRQNVWRRDKPKRWTLDRPGSSLCRIRVPDTMYPPLPWKEPGNDHAKLLFPVGVLRGWWTHTEIRYALSVGCDLLEQERSVWFDATEIPFRGFVDDLYALKLQGGWKELIAKLLLNNLYGKFQQCRSPGRFLPHYLYLRLCREEPEAFDKLKIVKELRDPRTGDITSVLIQHKGLVFPKHSNQHWGSEITAAARIKLHGYLTKYKAFYCDTDSVLFSGTLAKSSALGELSLQQEVSSALLRGPKAYLLRNGDQIKVRVKGVPSRPGWMQDAATGEYLDCSDIQQAALSGKLVAFDAPLKLMESFRKKTLPSWEEGNSGGRIIVDDSMDAKSNFWYPHTKQLKFENDKRIVPAGGGWTKPIRVEEGQYGEAKPGRRSPR